MNKEEYIEAVKNELGFMPYDEVLKAEEYFRSFFNCSKSEEEVIKSLGTPKEAARKYCVNNTEAEKKEQPMKKGGYTGLIIAVVLAVFLFPIWLPILIFALILCMALFLAAAAVSFGLWLGGGVVILSSLFEHMTIADKLMSCGGGFIMFGVGLMLSWLLVWALIRLSVWFIRKITRS